MRKRKILLAVWIALLLCGSVSISRLRQEQFEEHLENTIVDIQGEMETSSHELEKEWEALNRGDPEDVLYFLEHTTGPYYYDYLIQFNEHLRKKPKGNLLIGTFATQAIEGAFLEGCLIIRVSHSHVV